MPTASYALPYGVAAPGGRLPDSTRIGGVQLQVADLARSINYYQAVLGFRVISRSNTRVVLGSMGAAENPPLLELIELPGARPVPRRGRLGLYHFAVLLPDRPSLGRFLAHLGTIGVRAGSADHLVSEATYLTDPDGLGIEVYADRARHMWRIENRQPAMASEPLDVQSLLLAAGDIPWTGLPAGTTIGHVHLSVGDLQLAEDFYHNGLGFDKVVWNYPGALFLSAGGYHHHVGTNTWAADAPRATEQDARLLEWSLVLPTRDDVARVARRLAEMGAPVVEDAGGWVATDPWGTQVRIATESRV
jgi:catechol 2,3-dioxygenase